MSVERLIKREAVCPVHVQERDYVRMNLLYRIAVFALTDCTLYLCLFPGSAICLPAHRHAVLHLCHHWNAGELDLKRSESNELAKMRISH